MVISILFNNERKLRNGWWVAFFFLVLASILFPVIMLSKQYDFDITILHQSLIIITTSLICQLLRRKPLHDLFGIFNVRWMKELGIGVLIGAILMLTPALFLFFFTSITFQLNTLDLSSLFSAVILFVRVATAEEDLFRGFLFERLIEGIGKWPAQLIIAGLFLLTHIRNPEMTGSIKVFAGINIFLASIMFGLAFLKTNSLAIPIGIHFMANTMQGVVLGFGISGLKQTSILKPIFNGAPDLLTSGSFGLEASVPGMISIIVTIIFFYNIDGGNGLSRTVF
jgi:uncharacterized protein